MANRLKTYSKNKQCNLKIDEAKNVVLTKDNLQKKSKSNAIEIIDLLHEDENSVDSSHSLIVNKLIESEFDKLLRTKNYQPVGFKHITEPLHNSSLEVQEDLKENVQEKKKKLKKKAKCVIPKTRQLRNAKWLSESINNSLEVEHVNPNDEPSNLIVINSSDEHELSKNLSGINRLLPSSTPFVKSYKKKFVNESLSPISKHHVAIKRVNFEHSYCSIEITHDGPNQLLPKHHGHNHPKSKLNMRPYVQIERLPDDIIYRKTNYIKVNDRTIHIKSKTTSVPLNDFEIFASNMMQCSRNLDIQADEDTCYLPEENLTAEMIDYDISSTTSGACEEINQSSSIEIPRKKRKYCSSITNIVINNKPSNRLVGQLESTNKWNTAKETRRRKPDTETCIVDTEENNLKYNKDLFDSRKSPTTSQICNDQSSSIEFPIKGTEHRRIDSEGFYKQPKNKFGLKQSRNTIEWNKKRVSDINIQIENNAGEELQIDVDRSESILDSIAADTCNSTTDLNDITSCITIDSSNDASENVHIKSEFSETPTVLENCDDILDSYTNKSEIKKDKFVVVRRKRIYNVSMVNESSNVTKEPSLLSVINMDNSARNGNNLSASGLRKDRFVFSRRRNGTAMPMPIENPYPDGAYQNLLDVAVEASDITKNQDHSNTNEDSSVCILEETRSLSNIGTDQLQTSVVNNTKERITRSSEDQTDVFLVPRRFKIKPGKSWRRSMAFLKRSSMAVDLSSNVQNENVLGSFSLRKQLLDLSVCRQSVIKFIPTPSKTSDTNGSFQNDGYVPNNKTTNASVVHPSVANSIPFTEETALDQLLQLSVRHSKRFSLHPRLEFISARDLVLRRCEQIQPIPFTECFPDSLLKNCHKIGEGVYGEVFLYRNKKAGTSVMKVIPIQGDQIVNGERQKKFEEIISEIVIAQELSDLRNCKKNSTSCFNEVYKIHCVKGKYPERLLELWDLYEEIKGSDNDCPDIFGEDQLYIVLELANGGQDLESFVFKNAQHSFSVFKQIAFSLAVAETSLQFEHRDLHWGNVLISNTRHPKGTIFFNLNGRQVAVRSYNIQASIIDFTLSRITNDDICIFNDLSQDPDLFNAEGDYQFEIYRLMQKCNGNDWQQYKPYTNVLWLHYILDKMIHMVRYKSPTDKVHRENIERMQDLKDELFEFKSAEEFVIKNLM